MPGPGSYWIGREEKDEILDVLEGGYLSRYGDMNNPRFRHKVYDLEQEFAKYIGVPHALATTSGTASLLIGMLALGIKPGDEIIVPAYTFVASYSAAIFAGAVPVLAEIDDSLNLDPADIEKRITSKTRMIMPVHMLGNPCDMDSILNFAQRHGLLVLEDACQANGASYKGRKVGSLGSVGAFSLNVYKTITAGDGGILTASSPEIYQRAFALHDQGHSPLRARLEVGQRSILGLNFRINELTGAVALAQLRKIDRITAMLREKKAKLKQLIGGIPGVRFRRLNDSQGECGTLLTVLFDDAGKASRVAKTLGTKTVDQSGWHVYSNMEHVNQYLKDMGRPHGKGAYPRTDDLLSRAINISVGVVDPGLGSGFGISIESTDAEIKQTSEKFQQACHETRR